MLPVSEKRCPACEPRCCVEYAAALHVCGLQQPELGAARPFVLSDEAILAAMSARPSGIHTYVIRNILASEHGFGRALKTDAVRRRLIRIEAAGRVTRKRWGPGCSIEWAVSP